MNPKWFKPGDVINGVLTFTRMLEDVTRTERMAIVTHKGQDGEWFLRFSRVITVDRDGQRIYPLTFEQKVDYLKANCDDLPDPDRYTYGADDSAYAEAINDMFEEVICE